MCTFVFGGELWAAGGDGFNGSVACTSETAYSFLLYFAKYNTKT